MPSHQRVRYNKWRKFNRIFADGNKQVRYIREVIYGKRRSRQYWKITTNPETVPHNETWSVMTRIPDVKYPQVGNFYGLRNWVEYGLKQSKFVASKLMQFWLQVFPIPELSVGLNRLIAFMNRFPGAIPLAHSPADFHFSSA
jgi:hypothetical protein